MYRKKHTRHTRQAMDLKREIFTGFISKDDYYMILWYLTGQPMSLKKYGLLLRGQFLASGPKSSQK